MKKILILFISLFVLSVSYSQVSGYMGKKFSIIYSGGISFPHIKTFSPFKVSPSINHAFNVEYVIGNSTAVGLGYKLATNADTNPLKYYSYPEFKPFSRFYGHTYAAYLKFYSSKSLAPIGMFTKVGLGVQQLILANKIRPNYKTNIISGQNYSQFDIVFHLALGRNWIVMDRMLLGFQVETGFTPASFFRTLGISGSPYDPFDSDFNGYSSTSISSRYNFTTELLKISLNIGFLAF